MVEEGDIIDSSDVHYDEESGRYIYRPSSQDLNSEGDSERTIPPEEASAKERWEQAQRQNDRENRKQEKFREETLEQARNRGRELSWWVNNAEGQQRTAQIEETTQDLVKTRYESRLAQIRQSADQRYPGDREGRKQYVQAQTQSLEDEKQSRVQEILETGQLDNLDEKAFFSVKNPDFTPGLAPSADDIRNLRQFEDDLGQLNAARRYEEELAKPIGERDTPVSLIGTKLRMAGLREEEVKFAFAAGWEQEIGDTETDQVSEESPPQIETTAPEPLE